MASGTIYSKRLAQSVNLQSAIAFVVPAGKTWVVRDVAAYCPAAGGTPAMSVTVPGAGVIAAFSQSSATVAAVFHWEGMQVIRAGETLQLSGLGAVWQAMVSGYELGAS